jgi:YtkA-like
MIERVAVCFLSATVLATGCGGGAVRSARDLVFETQPFQSVRSNSGALFVAVYAEVGRTPARGENAFRYVVADSSGAPVDGVQLTVAPWMPDMGHGSSVTPLVTAAGAGAYVVTDVYFAMPGRWDLVSTFAGPVSDAAKPSFQIP